MTTTTKNKSKALPSLARRVYEIASNPVNYIWQTMAIKLRKYQTPIIKPLLNSIRNHLGLTFILILPRQSGKDELIINLLVFLLHIYATARVGIVVVNPTYKPQTITMMARFEAALKLNILTRNKWKKRADFIRRIGTAMVAFLSGEPSANVVGGTASLLIVVNEAQHILEHVYAERFEPMTASTNATRLITGTVWTKKTFLAKETRAALEAEKADGIKRVFMFNADDVRKVRPVYGKHVDAIVKKRGRHHPLVMTQYFNEELDAQGGMFKDIHLALIKGDQPPQSEPLPGHIYAFLLDVAGQEESQMSTESQIEANAARDAVTLRIIDVDLSTLELLQSPTYRAVHKLQWTGANHIKVFGALKSLAENWLPLWWVIDATGVGEGLWAMTDKAFPTKVIPLKFTAQSKSELGYGFLSIINSGRFRNCVPDKQTDIEYANCEYEILPGPQKTMRWGVPDGTRDSETGLLVHDDIPVTDSMTTILDKLEWSIQFETTIIQGIDPLPDMDRNY